ncbi:hypothetical protein WMF45_36270 [Sorangium sp. So ce448]
MMVDILNGCRTRRAGRDLLRGSNEGGQTMAPREAEVEDVLAGPAGRAEYEESHVMKTGRAAKT